MPIALFSRNLKIEDIGFVEKMLRLFQERQIDIWIYDEYYRQINSILPNMSNFLVFGNGEPLPNDVRFMWSIGGDGTLLNTATWIRNRNIPVIGINTGRLGLLADVGREQIEQALDVIQAGTYTIDRRSLLQINGIPSIFEPDNFALNEFTIVKQDTSAMIVVHAFVDGYFLNSYWADGIIVATPTGSTAYSLSCGGPIVHPHCQTFIVTPVAPHNLNVRPLLLPDTSSLSFKIEGRSSNFLCTLDSRHEIIDATHQLSVCKAPFSFQLLRMPDGNDFFATIRHKLKWGQDARN